MNLDKLHTIWMERYKELAYFLLGKEPCNAYVIIESDFHSDVTGEDYQYVSEGAVKLPTDAAKICNVMAKFAQTSLTNMRVYSEDMPLPDFPMRAGLDSYNLRSLLWASYPRATNKGMDVFKGDNVGVYIASDEVTEDAAPFVAFGGVGIILMEQCRMIIDETATDEEMISLCADRYILIEKAGLLGGDA